MNGSPLTLQLPSCCSSVWKTGEKSCKQAKARSREHWQECCVEATSLFRNKTFIQPPSVTNIKCIIISCIIFYEMQDVVFSFMWTSCLSSKLQIHKSDSWPIFSLFMVKEVFGPTWDCSIGSKQQRSPQKRWGFGSKALRTEVVLVWNCGITIDCKLFVCNKFVFRNIFE